MSILKKPYASWYMNMCVKPVVVHVARGPAFAPTEVPCGKCWACLTNRQNDLIAKCILEHMSSEWSYVLTLTYDDRRLDPSRRQTEVIEVIDFKRFMARLRKKFSVRYLVAGEFGKRKGRVHFHVALFGVGMPPEVTLFKEKSYFDAWPWGFTYAEPLTFRGIQYVAKYLTKKDNAKAVRDDPLHQEWVSYSTRPPMGIEHILRLADQYASERVMPRSFRINPPGLEGINRRFQISGVSQHLFLERLFSEWPEAFEKPATEWIANARLRYIKWRALKSYEAMPDAERSRLLADEFAMRQFQKPLTQKDYLWEDWLYTPAAAGYFEDWTRTIRWLEAREREAIGGRHRARPMSVGQRFGRRDR